MLHRMWISALNEVRANRASERGQILPLVAIALVALIGMAALAIDVGYWRYQQRLEQSAADSAAMAAAVQLSYGQTSSLQSAGRADAATNGFIDDAGATVNVTINNPPVTAGSAYLHNTNAVEAIVQKKQPAFFGGIFGNSYQWVTARAVAARNSAGRGCIYALDKSGTGNALTINGATVNVPTCGMMSNGSVLINGATVTASSIGYVTSDTVNGSTLKQATPLRALPVSDPCQTVAGCRYLAANPPAHTGCTQSTYNGLSSVIVNPGTYCSQLLFNGCGNITFMPGVYDLEQGMLINGSQNVSGSGVTFYNEGAPFTFNGSSGSVTAPSTGNTTGVLLYQVAGDSSNVVLNGSGTGLGGAVYAPGAQITLNGGLSTWLLAIGDTVLVNGSGLNVPSADFPGLGHFVLAE